MRSHWMEEDEDVAVGLDWSLFCGWHCSKKGENQVEVEEYVDVVVGDVGRRHWGLEVRQMVWHVEYVDRLLDFGIEEASSEEAQLIHAEKDSTHHHHRHRRPFSPSH
jgi:hypothetical protein